MNFSLSTLIPYTESYFLVFSRLFFFFLFMPGFVSVFVPGRIRLLMALSVSYAAAPMIGLSPSFSLLTCVKESFFGFFLATVIRLLFEGVSMVGGVLSHQSSFGNAMGSALTQETEDLFSSFCTLYFITLFFATELHIVLIRGVVNSYDLLPIGSEFVYGDMSSSVVHYLAQGFEAAISLAAPFLIFGVFYHILLGLLNRIVPMLPVIFIGHPISLFIILIMLMICISRLAVVFSEIVSRFAEGFFA